MHSSSLWLNGLANTSILGGKTTAQISNQYHTLITPAVPNIVFTAELGAAIVTAAVVAVALRSLRKTRETPVL